MQEPTRLVRPQHTHAARRSLPVPPTPLIGREQEVSTVCTLLQDQEVHLLTLTGTAGVGKTRLALQVAAEMAEAFTNGVQFVPLATLSDPELVLPTIAQALGLRESVGQSFAEVLQTALREQHLLLVLDNFEQVVLAAPSLADVLEHCPALTLLVTSREVLRLRAEHQFPLQPLALPPLLTRGEPARATLAENPSVQLFLHRAQAAHPAVQLTASNAASIAEICCRLEGIPLALELAAPRLKLLSPQALLARLEGRLHVLTGGARDLPEHLRAMRTAIAWSYELLTPAEQALFRRLAVFVGGWTLAAAEQVCQVAGALELEVLDGLAALLDKSLIQKEQTGEGDSRFRMLYVLREFGLEQLAATGELAVTGAAHADYFLALVEEAEPHLRGGELAVWLKRLETEHDNVRAALGHVLAAGARELAARLAGALWRFWAAHGHFSEGRHWLERILANPESLSPSALSKVLFAAGMVTQQQGEYERARTLFDQALTLQRRLEDQEGIAETLSHMGLLAVYQEDYEQAARLSEESLERYRKLDNQEGVALALQGLAMVALIQGEYARAAALSEESVTLKREVQNLFAFQAYTLSILAAATLFQGDDARAIQAAREAVAVAQDLGHKHGLMFGLLVMGGIAGTQGQAERAAHLFGAAAVLREAHGAPLIAGLRPVLERLMKPARDQLGAAAFAEAWAQGRALPLEQAIAEAEHTTLSGQGISARPAPRYPDGLTQREVEVLRLLAQGLTNPKIAERLIVSKETVHSHVSTIYSKIGVTTRAAATRYTVDHGLDVEDEA